jgi:hypothetical protein
MWVVVRTKQLVPLAVLTTGWFGLLVYAHPGYMSFDSIEQLRQARSGTYSDWHPPAMAALWRLVEHVWRGPLGMFILQSVAFIVGAYLLLRRWFSPVTAAVACVLISWFPPVSSILGVIWKDSQMLGYAMLGVALLARGTRRSQLVALAALALASAMRHNAFTITFAPVVLLFDARPGTWRRARRYAAAAAVWLAVTAAGFVANVALTDVHTHPWTDVGETYDIAGIFACAPDISDDDARALLADTPFTVTSDIQAQLASFYEPGAGVIPLWNAHLLRQPRTETQRAAIDRAWNALVRAYPGAYLEHRALVFAEQLQLGVKPRANVWVGIDRIGYDLYGDRPTPTQQVLRDWQGDIGEGWLYWPWLYLAETLVMLPLAVRRRDTLAVALGLSGVFSLLPLFIIAPAATYRYASWLVVATLFGAIALATAMLGNHRARRAPP